MSNNQDSVSINYYINGLKYSHWEVIEDNCLGEFIDDESLDCSNEKCSDNYNSKCNICSPKVAGTGAGKYCMAGLRIVLGYLKNVGATDIIVETIASQPAVNNQSVIRFYPNRNNECTASLVQFSCGEIVSICQIEIIQSSALVDSSSGFMLSMLKAALDRTIFDMHKIYKKSCEEQLRMLFADNIGNQVSNIDTNKNSVISGRNNVVIATGLGVVLINLSGNDGVAVNLCFVSSVSFQ